jgi:hypothetical protein
MTSKLAAISISFILICDRAPPGQREHIEPMAPEQAVTVVPNMAAQTLWYRQYDVFIR